MTKIAADFVKGKASGIPLDEWSGSKATKELEETIKRIDRQNTAQGRLIVLLTLVAAVGAAIAAVPVVEKWLQ